MIYQGLRETSESTVYSYCIYVSYFPHAIKVSAFDLFKVSPAVLESKGTADERAATRRLMDLIDTEDKIPDLITTLSEEPTERLQVFFPYNECVGLGAYVFNWLYVG